MSSTALYGQPTVLRLPTLMREVAEGRLLIPDFQRPFVWKDEQRLELLDSIRQGLPIGSLLIWQTTKHTLKSYERLGPFRLRAAPGNVLRSYVLDGHQRLSTLYGALHAPDAEEPTDEATRVRWPIYYDLEKETFRLLPRGARLSITWLPMSLLLNASMLFAHLKKLLEAGHTRLARDAERLAEQFKDYSVPVVPIVTEELQPAIDSFRRVNSAGTPMSEVFLVRALTWQPDFDLYKQLEDIITENLEPLGWGRGIVDPQFLLDVFKLQHKVAVYDSSLEHLKTLVEESGGFQVLTRDLVTAIRFLTESPRLQIPGPSFLPYRYQLACFANGLSAALDDVNEEGADGLQTWFWATTYAEYFSGIGDRALRDAVEHVVLVACGQAKPLPADLAKEVAPLGAYRASSARGRALALLLLRQNPPSVLGKPQPKLAEQVAADGAEAVAKIVSAVELGSLGDSDRSDAAENRWIAPRAERKRMLAELKKGKAANGAFLAGHLIPAEAAEAYKHGDYENFLRLRRQQIVQVERAFVRSIGLTYAGAPFRPPVVVGVQRKLPKG